MSRNKKKRKQQNQSRNFPWLFIALGGVLLVVVAVLFANRSGGDDGTPVLRVDQDVIDYGEVKLDTPLTFSVVVTNAGDGVLRFEEDPYIEVREGC